MQGDSQLISALAIIIASLVNIYKDDETPLYRIFIARILADICLRGHSASIILVPRTEHNWIFRFRLLMCTIDLWEFWSYAAIPRWNWETPHCLENETFIPGDYARWILWSLVWMPLGYIPFLLNISEAGRKLTDRVEGWIITCPLSVIEHAKEIRTSRSIGHFLGKASISIVEALLCVLFLAFAVLIPTSCTLLAPCLRTITITTTIQT